MWLTSKDIAAFARLHQENKYRSTSSILEQRISTTAGAVTQCSTCHRRVCALSLVEPADMLPDPEWEDDSEEYEEGELG